MNQPVVEWPLQPSAPQSSMLELTAQRPLGMDVRFSCRAARLAAQSPDGIVVATLRPGQPSLDELGLVVRATDDRVMADVSGKEVLDDVLGGDECRYTLAIQGNELTVSKDDHATPDITSVTHPQVDVLATSIVAIPGGNRGDLSVTVAVDDQFSTSPSTVKLLLTAVLVVAAALSLVMLAVRDRPTKPSKPDSRGDRAPPGRRFTVRAVDLVVPAILVLWLFIAPMTDDDGYYAAMARNSPLEGYVGNYYQLLNQSFTPFTWFYRVLGYWESLVGSSQVLLRIPALVAGLLTWALLRRFISRIGSLPVGLPASSTVGRAIVSLTLAVTFLAAWLPYDMGVRPEGIVALLSAAVLVLVQSAIREQRLLPVGLAGVFAALSIICHPTGFVALAPLIAGLPSLWPLSRDRSPRMTAANVVAVLAPAGLASAVAFGDGSLRDFIHGQDIFLSRFAQTEWYEEYTRYTLLFLNDPQGNFAKRAPVLVGIACLVWFGVLFAASRGKGIRVSPELRLAGSSLALALVLLWITPSKWTHHFGSLAALGPVFLTVFLLSAPGIVARLGAGKGVARPVSLAVAFTSIVVFALSFHGPNAWPYSWLLGMPYAGLSPRVGPLILDSLALWAVGYGLVFAALGWWARHRKLRWRRLVPIVTAPTMAVLFLLLSTGYLVGSFGVATLRTWDSYSPWANNLQDPFASECDAAGAINVLADSTARPLTQVAEPSGQGNSSFPFVEDGGFPASAPPPGGVGSPAATQVWGSLAGAEAATATGTFASPWFALPDDLAGDEALGILAAGRLDAGNSLVVEYADLDGGRVDSLGREEITDNIDMPVWRSVPLDLDDAVDDGATMMRLLAEDATADDGGWLAFTAPSVQREISLQDYLPAEAAVAVSWQFALMFPCQRQPIVQDGITEPVEFGVVYGTQGISGLFDNTWTIYAGGLFGPVTRVAGITALPAQFPDFPHVTTVQVYRFDNPYPIEAYELRTETRALLGWQSPSL